MRTPRPQNSPDGFASNAPELAPGSLLAACCILLTGLPSFAENGYEYGKPAELKNLKKVFIDTGSDVAERNSIAEVIEKARLAGLEIIDSVDQAEIVLQFSGAKEQRVTSSQSGVLSIQTTFV